MAESLTYFDVSDRELLNIMRDVRDDDYWIYFEDLQRALGVSGRSLSSRLGRMGSAETGLKTIVRDKDEARYQLTEFGEAIADGAMRAAQRKAAEDARPAELVSLTESFGDRFLSADMGTALLMRRSWNVAQKKRKFSRNGGRRRKR